MCLEQADIEDKELPAFGTADFGGIPNDIQSRETQGGTMRLDAPGQPVECRGPHFSRRLVLTGQARLQRPEREAMRELARRAREEQVFGRGESLDGQTERMNGEALLHEGTALEDRGHDGPNRQPASRARATKATAPTT